MFYSLYTETKMANDQVQVTVTSAVCFNDKRNQQADCARASTWKVKLNRKTRFTICCLHKEIMVWSW